MSWISDEFALLRDTISGEVRRFEGAHAEALLAYPGTVWAEVKEDIHDAAQTVADWSAAPVAVPEPAPESTPEPTTVPEPAPVPEPTPEPVPTPDPAPVPAEPVPEPAAPARSPALLLTALVRDAPAAPAAEITYD